MIKILLPVILGLIKPTIIDTTPVVINGIPKIRVVWSDGTVTNSPTNGFYKNSLTCPPCGPTAWVDNVTVNWIDPGYEAYVEIYPDFNSSYPGYCEPDQEHPTECVPTDEGGCLCYPNATLELSYYGFPVDGMLIEPNPTGNGVSIGTGGDNHWSGLGTAGGECGTILTKTITFTLYEIEFIEGEAALYEVGNLTITFKMGCLICPAMIQ